VLLLSVHVKAHHFTPTGQRVVSLRGGDYHCLARGRRSKLLGEINSDSESVSFHRHFYVLQVCLLISSDSNLGTSLPIVAAPHGFSKRTPAILFPDWAMRPGTSFYAGQTPPFHGCDLSVGKSAPCRHRVGSPNWTLASQWHRITSKARGTWSKRDPRR
jgi:hypothetical protein